MPNVVKIQKSYVVEPLSNYLKQPAAPPIPTIDWPAFNGDEPFKLQFPKYVSFLLQFARKTHRTEIFAPRWRL